MIRSIRFDWQSSRLTGMVLSGFMLAGLMILLSPAQAQDKPLTGVELEPSADYSPQDVVQIVVNALGNNSAYGNDQGIATVYRFASPGNRAHTGPLSRFTSMIRMGFKDMLDHQGSSYDEMEIDGDVAVQAVWLTTAGNREVGYAFQIGRQKAGEYAGMWMTDAVVPLGTREGQTRI